MILTKKERLELLNALADVGAQASLLEMGAIAFKDILFAKLDSVIEKVTNAQVTES